MTDVRLLSAPLILLRALAASAILLASGALHAQALPPGVRLGMSAEELQAALPAAERVHRPQRLGGGLVGSWRAAPVEMAGLLFEPTFFFAASELRRVEYAASAQSAPDAGAAAFASLVQWGRGVFGNELASRDPGSAYAAWVSGDTDVYVQQLSDPRRASVRLVYKARQLRDGSEL
ncbi:hypothetical protein QMO14_08140 [Variovorax sp. CAN2819]|uniref:hypothetical protein n=1 Tax=Variovorax sp. CAN15 TaxID=3046727 RepID=UPI00264A3878|nr:hypothetical protein [Variovorax sp. CAN15]MDN6883562.1 hypothetical protein [Variovorax sp. CAN15]